MLSLNFFGLIKLSKKFIFESLIKFLDLFCVEVSNKATNIIM